MRVGFYNNSSIMQDYSNNNFFKKMTLNNKNLCNDVFVKNQNINFTGNDSFLSKYLIKEASSGNFDSVRELLIRGADPNFKNENSNTALMISASNRNPGIIKLMLEYGADPNIQNASGATALMWSMERDSEDKARVLLKGGADPNIQNEDGQTALIKEVNSMISTRKKERIQLLLEYGADINIIDNKGKTALDYANGPYREDIASFLKESCNLVNDIKSVVEKDPYEFDINEVIQLLSEPEAKEFVNIKFPNVDNSNLLHLLAGRKIDDADKRKEQLNLISYLIKLDADINAKNEVGNTPLAIAAMKGDEAVVRFLLKKGANPSIKNKFDCKPEFYAVKENFKNIITLLQAFEE